MKTVSIPVPTLDEVKRPFKALNAKIEARRARRAALDAIITNAVAKAAKEKQS